MRLRRTRGDAQPLADLVVREPGCDQFHHLALAIGDPQVPLGQYLCHDADANNGLAACTLTERRIRENYVPPHSVIEEWIIYGAITRFLAVIPWYIMYR